MTREKINLSMIQHDVCKFEEYPGFECRHKSVFEMNGLSAFKLVQNWTR